MISVVRALARSLPSPMWASTPWFAIGFACVLETLGWTMWNVSLDGPSRRIIAEPADAPAPPEPAPVAPRPERSGSGARAAAAP